MDGRRNIELLNVQYSVFLGVIVAICFYVDTNAANIVRPVVDVYARPEALCFAIYFLLDWVTANFLHQRRIVMPAALVFRLIWVAVLGVVVISLNGMGLWKFILLAGYTTVSGVYDLLLVRPLLKRPITPGAVAGILLAATRILTGLVLLIPIISAMLGRMDALAEWDDPNCWQDPLFFFVLFYLLLKSTRFAYLARVTL
ncbi:hypothetical protein MUP01_01450 [Candidatus Bathyarchaeota archaeon]|nr:hypothetical protein [Candidatus Bathyarchaeota archaeon]